MAIEEFGGTVAGLVAEVAHIDAYPTERSENLKKAGADTKRARGLPATTSIRTVARGTQILVQVIARQPCRFTPCQRLFLDHNFGDDCRRKDQRQEKHTD